MLQNAFNIGSSIGRQVAQRAGWSGTGTRTKQVTSGVGVTNQFDRSLVYRKRRMPRRKKRRWIKFVRKVSAAQKLGTRTQVMNDAYNISGTAGLQGLYDCCIYGKISSLSNAGHNDLAIIDAADADITPLNSRVQFKSAILDLTATNSSTETSRNLEVDVYEWTIFKNREGDTNLVNALTSANNAVNMGTALALTQRGVGLFDIPNAISGTKLRILKKTKYILGAGQSFTYQLRQPRNQFVNYSRIESNVADAPFLPGKTRGLFFIYKLTAKAGADVDVPQLSVGLTRKYSYSVLEGNEDKEGYH